MGILNDPVKPVRWDVKQISLWRQEIDYWINKNKIDRSVFLAIPMRMYGLNNETTVVIRGVTHPKRLRYTAVYDPTTERISIVDIKPPYEPNKPRRRKKSHGSQFTKLRHVQTRKT